MKTPVYIRHKVGQCPICGSPLLDAGWTDDHRGWSHAYPWHGGLIKPQADPALRGPCTMELNR